MSEFLCVGDVISLYCEETEGYVYNCQTRFARPMIGLRVADFRAG